MQAFLHQIASGLAAGGIDRIAVMGKVGETLIEPCLKGVEGCGELDG